MADKDAKDAMGKQVGYLRKKVETLIGEKREMLTKIETLEKKNLDQEKKLFNQRVKLFDIEESFKTTQGNYQRLLKQQTDAKRNEDFNNESEWASKNLLINKELSQIIEFFNIDTNKAETEKMSLMDQNLKFV